MGERRLADAGEDMNGLDLLATRCRMYFGDATPSSRGRSGISNRCATSTQPTKSGRPTEKKKEERRNAEAGFRCRFNLAPIGFESVFRDATPSSRGSNLDASPRQGSLEKKKEETGSARLM